MGKAEATTVEIETSAPVRNKIDTNSFEARIVHKMFPSERKNQQETDSGFTIAKALRLDTNQTVILKGSYGPIGIGEELKVLQSVFQKDLRYGDYYQVIAVEFRDPTDHEGIITMVTRMVAGNKKLASAAYWELGDETISELDKNPELLNKIARDNQISFGNSKTASAEAINAASLWVGNRQRALNTRYLLGIGFTNSQSRRIAKHFRDEDIAAIINFNPYYLCDVERISFERIDKLAQEQCGMTLDDPRRITASIVDIVAHSEDDGHICLDQEDLFARAEEQLDKIDRTQFERSVEAEIRRGNLHREEGRIYAFENYLIETRLIELLNDRLDQPETPLPPSFHPLPGSLLTDEQFSASEHAMQHRLSVLLGSAGTGKTTSMRELIDNAEQHGRKVRCLAPTGKAAKRMEESTGRPASTIHRAIGMSGMNPPNISEERFFDPKHKIREDIVIIDEASMLDMRVAERLFSHISEDSHIVLVGDPNQLPPVGAGSVLLDTVESEQVPVTNLTRIFRQAEDSLLVVNANRVRQGIDPYWSKAEAEADLGRPVREDWVFIEDNDPISVTKKVVDMRAADPDALVTAPTRMSKSGTLALNRAMQDRFNPNGAVVIADPEIGEVRVGDLVMNIKNIYGGKRGVDIMNGDTGTVLDRGAHGVTIDFGFKKGPTTLSIDQIEHEGRSTLIPAYASTTHKLQGSEAETIICPLAGTGGERLASRNMLYTAWTRGKEKCVVIGDKEKIRHAVGIDGIQRQTTLDLKLRDRELEKRKRVLAEAALDSLVDRYSLDD